jgi:hypothetical protein
MPVPSEIPNHQRKVVLILIALFVLGIVVFFAVIFFRFMAVGEGMH